MKKSLIALAVAGALTAPMVAQADATLYGSLRLKAVAADKKDFNVADNSSRIGIKGSVDTNIDGVKAIYHGEWKVGNNDDASFGDGRLAYVGLTGGFGTAAIGQQWTPEYSFATGTVDILDGNSTALTVDVFRSPNVISYVTPNMGGFSGALAVVADSDAGNNGEDVDSYHVAAKYSVAGFTAAASFIDDASDDDEDRTAVSVAYAADALYVALLWQDRDAVKYEDDSYELAASYAFGDTSLIGNYASEGDASGYGLEVQHKLGKQARVFANYLDVNDDAAASNFAQKADTFSTGLRVDF
ncbi:porin [Neptunomonas qingdaonensis]|uniref:Outer membrane protein (Porin) n=1 Tax=Neptunomonas qingdaonensis TaxID=1045558 RepID=A0A1I2SQ75_9GAMM|nr:porin [Neptunomonas qingdaonensis]SFG54812.1 Outer membrane protein (porin) [Neptunomonas qingdaonensis]